MSHIEVESIEKFEQTDENHYELALFGHVARSDGDWEDELHLHLDTIETVRLFNLLRRVIGPYVAEMEREQAAFFAASEEERAQVLGLDSPDEFVDKGMALLGYADLVNKARKENQ